MQEQEAEVVVGGGGSSGGSSHGSHHASRRSSRVPYYTRSNKYRDIIVTSIIEALSIVVACPAIWVLKGRLIRAKIKTKCTIEKNNLNYEDIEKRVIETYFAVQKAWANNDMSAAKNYMMPELLESFKIKLNWINFSGKRNIMKNIKLLNAYPVSLNSIKGDQIWFYIKGKMVDYVLDTNKNEIVEGSSISKSFTEYWLFSKNENNELALSKILQRNEFNKVLL